MKIELSLWRVNEIDPVEPVIVDFVEFEMKVPKWIVLVNVAVEHVELDVVVFAVDAEEVAVLPLSTFSILIQPK